MDALEKDDVESRPVWKPMHLQPVFAEKDFVTSLETALCTVDFENGADSSISGTIFRRGVCLPSDTKMDEEDLDRICTVIEGLW